PAPPPAPPPSPPPEPIPAPPPPRSTAAPTVAPDAPATLAASGATVELRGEFGAFRPGTPLVSGDYEVWADFGDGFVDTSLRTSASPGRRVDVSCSRAQRKCFVTPRSASVSR
ncbi:MAG: hypothetical protein AAF602_30525, partial [Myxococcota bacterium]